MKLPYQLALQYVPWPNRMSPSTHYALPDLQ
jgi:hypothetical protein